MLRRTRSIAIGGAATALVAASLMGTGAFAQSADTGIAGTTLTVWTMEDATAFEALIAPFEERSGVSVDVEAVPWDAVNDKLTTAVASGISEAAARIAAPPRLCPISKAGA